MKEKKTRRPRKRIKDSIIFSGNMEVTSGSDYNGLRILIDRDAALTGEKSPPDLRLKGTKIEDIHSLSQKSLSLTRKSGSHSLAEVRHFKSSRKW